VGSTAHEEAVAAACCFSSAPPPRIWRFTDPTAWAARSTMRSIRPGLVASAAGIDSTAPALVRQASNRSMSIEQRRQPSRCRRAWAASAALPSP
jgi:hypothetical protein